MQQWCQLLARVALTISFLCGTLAASAHETDNFSLPLNAELADLGPFLEALHTAVLQDIVAEANNGIEKALRIRNQPARAARLEHFHDPQTLSKAFIRHFGHPMFEDSKLESALEGAWARQSFPGQFPTYQDRSMNLSAHFLLDPRRWTVLTQSRTIKAFGIYFGTDKIVHFHHLGEDYYRMYMSLIGQGWTKEKAYGEVLKHFTEGGFFSEKAFFGSITTGVYSNADLAANHVGFKFYLNLTEAVVLKGEKQEPLLVRSGVFWRLNRHVRPRSGWFSVFISDHWNEALNPNRYDSSMRPGIERALQHRAESIVRFYTEKDDRPRNPAYFDALARELSTYYGENYGHSGDLEHLMTIGNTCFNALEGSRTENPTSTPNQAQ